MARYIILILLITSALFAKDYYTLELLKTNSLNEANAITEKYKGMGFDAFTQFRPKRNGQIYLSCINKFKSREEAYTFARNLKTLGLYTNFKVSTVLSRGEWLARYSRPKVNKRLPAKTKVEEVVPEKEVEPIEKLQSKARTERKLAAITPYKPQSFKGKPAYPMVTNPQYKDQKFVSTEYGLFVSIPTSRNDHWEKIPTDFNSKNAFLHFTKDGTLYVGHHKLDIKNNLFQKVISKSKFHLTGYKVSKVYEKEGILWITFSKLDSREPASDKSKPTSRIFISADKGGIWSELPAIIKKKM